jgi:hypothetical protein
MAIRAAQQIGHAMGYQTADENRAEEIQRTLNEAQLEVVTQDDPARARLELLTAAARRFNARGMTDVVQQIMPELLSVHRQIKEMRKIDQEAFASGARAQETLLDTEIKEQTKQAAIQEAFAKAQAAGQGWEVWYSQDTGKAVPVNSKNPKMTDYYASLGYFPYAPGLLSTEGLPSKLTPGKASEVLVGGREFAVAASDYLGQMTSILPNLVEYTKTGSFVGAGAKVLQNLRYQAQSLMRSRGLSKEEIELTREGVDPRALITSLGLRRKELENAVLDMAYARARQRDPGGRLSNQDVEMAVRVFNANNSLEMLVTLQNERSRLEREMGNRWGANPELLQDDPGMQTFRRAADAFDRALLGTASPKRVEDMTDEELMQELQRAD